MQRIQITGGAMERDSISFAIYLKEIRRVGFLTPAEEGRLIKAYRAGNLNALEKIVSANLRFVVSIARYYQCQGISLPDLISEGNIGLIRAVEKFDETKGFKFISYAIWWIRQSIVKALSEHSRIIRLPRNKVALLHKITRIIKQLEQEFEREPAFEELAALSGFETQLIKSILHYKVKQISIDAPVALDGGSSLLDVIEDINAELPDKHIASNESLETVVRFSLAELSENERKVVKMYYGLDGEEEMNHREIGKKLNVSGERIRQIKDTALIRIKQSSHSKKLKECMGSV